VRQYRNEREVIRDSGAESAIPGPDVARTRITGGRWDVRTRRITTSEVARWRWATTQSLTTGTTFYRRPFHRVPESNECACAGGRHRTTLSVNTNSSLW